MKLSRRKAWNLILSSYRKQAEDLSEPMNLSDLGLCWAINSLFDYDHKNDIYIGIDTYRAMKRDIKSIAPPRESWTETGHYWPIVADENADGRGHGVHCRIKAIEKIIRTRL